MRANKNATKRLLEDLSPKEKGREARKERRKLKRILKRGIHW